MGGKCRGLLKGTAGGTMSGCCLRSGRWKRFSPSPLSFVPETKEPNPLDHSSFIHAWMDEWKRYRGRGWARQ